MRPTSDQLNAMITSSQSIFIRMIGFLIVRLVLYEPFNKMWKLFEPHLLDSERMRSVHGEDMYVGEFVERLLMEDKYGEYCVLPRL